ncbi:hypothetical protein MKQ68_25350 [Chitinophaga horti]|uniref:Lipoprotein n=1 Tax=Chitinophaga horti TaxID=2920382 RepID=A0ABY6J457_9BACT|nr:hypothetical protein [Chitinophaga horti]UYQ93412.1 hypothetical protein MKQ68_25350 [Chitinophaga horti]
MKSLTRIAIASAFITLGACHQNSQNTPGVPDSSEISTRESDSSLIHNKPDSSMTPGPTIEKDTVQHETE